MREASGYCEWCDKWVLVRQVHGFWGWRAWRCTFCGNPTSPGGPGTDAARKVLLVRVGLLVFVVGCVLYAAIPVLTALH